MAYSQYDTEGNYSPIYLHNLTVRAHNFGIDVENYDGEIWALERAVEKMEYQEAENQAEEDGADNDIDAPSYEAQTIELYEDDFLNHEDRYGCDMDLYDLRNDWENDWPEGNDMDGAWSGM